MSALETAPILALLGLGALHGVNPGMGWLFAVALGLQEKKGRAVWRALPPLAIGHAAAVAVVVAIAALVGHIIPLELLRYVVAAILVGFGLQKLLRGHRHPRFGGMRVGPRDLAVWSFLMASAHGAGLMVLPFVIGNDAQVAHAAHGHAAHANLLAGQGAVIGASVLHAMSYLLATGCIAVIVYHKLGLRLLRSAWINLDVIWAGALIATGLITPLL